MLALAEAIHFLLNQESVRTFYSYPYPKNSKYLPPALYMSILEYSRLRNKRRGTLINFGVFFQWLRAH